MSFGCTICGRGTLPLVEVLFSGRVHIWAGCTSFGRGALLGGLHFGVYSPSCRLSGAYCLWAGCTISGRAGARVAGLGGSLAHTCSLSDGPRSDSCDTEGAASEAALRSESEDTTLSPPSGRGAWAGGGEG